MAMASSRCRPSARSARSWPTSPASTICTAARRRATRRRESLAYCDAAYASATDAGAAEMVANPFGEGKISRATPLIGNVVHLNEHYGNLVTYFRIKGMVPPSSKRGM